MASPKKRIAIVGGGFSGAGCIIALKEVGLEPVCFEAQEQFGGTWCYREESSIGFASLMSTTVANNSKEMGAVSNFPPPKEFSTYLSHKELLEYAKSYVKLKDCEKYFRFNSEVLLVRREEDYEETGRFQVTVKDRITGKESMDSFDGVMIATGHFAYPKIPNFDGQENFKGTVMHTHSLKRAEKFKGQNVLIVGAGCSGLDAAEMISSVAKNVYLSARSGFYALGRQGPNGYPSDYLILRRYLAWCLEILPTWLCSWYLETFYADTKFDHRLYNVQPQYHVLSKDPVFNDAIASRLLSGAIIQKGDVKYLTEHGATFEGDESITQIDAIVMATGYEFKYPFLEEGLLEIEDGKINLYKCMYPVQLPHETLVFIGLLNPFGPGIPLGEMQCRYAAHIFSGKGKLPPKSKMLKDINKRHSANVKRYAPSSFQSIRVDFLPYMDDLASKIGCKPNILKYLFTDFPLFLRLVFGPVLSYQYRLEGPHKWNGARDAIMSCHERILYPLVRDKLPKKGALQLIFEFIGNIVPKNIFNF